MRRVFRRALALGAIATLAAAAAFLAYLQTEPGFQRVLVPLTARLLGGDLTAARGKVSFDGTIEIEDGTYRDETAGFAVAVTRLAARIAPLSLLPGEPARIESLEADGLGLTIEESPPTSKPTVEEAGEAADEESIGFAIPLRIDDARLRGASIVVRRSAERQVEIGPFDAHARDLGPGSNGELALDGVVTFAADTPEAGSANVRATADLAGDAAGRVTRGKIAAALGLTLAKQSEMPPIELRLSGDASVGEGRSIDFALRVDGARTGDHLAATGSWPADADPLKKPPSLKAELKIDDLSRLDAILAVLGWNLFESGRVDAAIEIAPAPGDASRVKTRIEGERLSVRLAAGSGSTPPLALNLLQQGSWSPAKKQLRVDAASLRAETKEGGTVRSTLDGNLLLDFDSHGGATAAGAEPAVWTAEVTGVDIAHLDAWLATFGSHVLDGLRGKVGGKLRVEVAELGGRIAATGRLGIEGLRTSASEATPLEVASDLDLAVRDLERIAISSVELKLAAAGQPLFAAAVTGDYDMHDGAGRLEIGLDSDDLAAALFGLGVLPPDARDRIRGGTTSGTFQASLGKAVDVTGAASVDGIELAPGNGARRRQNLRVEADAGSGDGIVEIRRLVVSVADPEAREPGAIEVSGALPSSAETVPRETELKVALRRLALGHWIEALGGPSVETLGPVLCEGDLTVRRAAGESRLTIEGEERFTLRSAAARETIEVTTRNTVEHLPSEATKFSAVLSTRESNRDTGLMKIEGVLGSEGALRVDVDIDRLRFREIDASSGSVKLDRAEGRTLVEIAPTDLAGGRIEGRLDYRATDARSLAWSLRTRKVDVGRLHRSLVGDARRVEGILDLDTTGRGAGRDADQLRRNIDGGLEASMSKARLASTPILTYLARVTGISEFEDLTFNSVVADVAIGEGLARIRRMEGSGQAANLEVTGQATLAGDLDLRVNPRVGPSLAGSVEKIFAVGMLVRTVADFVALPINVTVKGPYDNPKYAVEPRVPGALDRLSGGVAGEAAGAVIDTGKAVGGGILKGMGGILKEGGSLFRGRKQGQPERQP